MCETEMEGGIYREESNGEENENNDRGDDG